MDLKENTLKSSFTIVDTETTGLEKHSKIVSIGAVKVSKGAIHINQILSIETGTKDSNELSVAIHEIIDTNSSDQKVLIRRFLEFIQASIIVGHHIDFDIKMLNQWIASLYPGLTIKNKTLDTAHLAKRLHAEELTRMVGGNHFLGLDNLCQLYNIPVENRHTSLGDAYITGLLLLKLLNQLEKRGITQLSQLHQK